MALGVRGGREGGENRNITLITRKTPMGEGVVVKTHTPRPVVVRCGLCSARIVPPKLQKCVQKMLCFYFPHSFHEATKKRKKCVYL